MKLLTIKKDNRQTLGVKIHKGIIDVEKSLSIHSNWDVPTDVMDVIKGGQKTIKKLQSYIDYLLEENSYSYITNENEINWGPAVPAPNKIICVGLNYRKHADETNSPYPETPILFPKFNNALAGHLEEISIPNVTEKLDYEVELGIVIGQETKNVSTENALNHVFGYVAVNDLSARDLQFVSSQWMLGKTCDGFCPVGPYVVTSNEVGNPNELNIKTYVNGEERQNSNTADMIFHCDEIISYISKHMTLVPGDLIITGTPEGVALGDPKGEERWIQPKDNVTIEIEKIGSLTNTFIK